MGWTWDSQGGGENNGGLVWDGAAFNAEVEAKKRQWQQDMVAYRAAQGLSSLSPAQLDDLYNQRVAAVSAQDNRNHNIAIASMIGGGLAAAYGGAAGAGAGNSGVAGAGGTMEMAPAWTAAESAAAGGGATVAGATGVNAGTGQWAAQDLATASGSIPAASTGGAAANPALFQTGAAAAAPLATQGLNGPGQNPTDVNGNVVPPNSTGMDTGQNPYQFPYQSVFQQLYGAYTANQSQNNAEALLDKLINSDQWRSQAPRYYEPLYNAATKGIGDTEYGRSLAESTARQSASKGYNMSGNMLTDIAKSLNTGTADYVRAITPLAMGRGETQAGSTVAKNILGGSDAEMAAYGGTLNSIFRGQQPSANTNQQPNQNFFQSLQGI